MKHTLEKLNEYGLKPDVESNEFENWKQFLFKEEHEPSFLPIKLSRLSNIVITDINIFKTKFQVPDKYDELMDEFISELTIRFFEVNKGEASFATPDYVIRLDPYIGYLVKKNQEKYLKTNKKFKVRSIFNKETATNEFENEMVGLAISLLNDPATQVARQLLFEEIVVCLLKDRSEFLAAAAEKTVSSSK